MCRLNTSKEGTKIILAWERDDAEDIEKAKTFFKKLTRQGWFAVPVSRDKSKLRRILEFKEYGKLCFIPLSEGG